MRSKAQALTLAIAGFFILGFFRRVWFLWFWVFYESKLSVNLNVPYDPPIEGGGGGGAGNEKG